MAKSKEKLQVNDLARVIQDDGELSSTLYIVDWLGEGPYRHRCCIREAGNPLAGSRDFDVSLLRKVSRDEPIRRRVA